jgi:hypothetical protein
VSVLETRGLSKRYGSVSALARDLNVVWDGVYAVRRVEDLGISLHARVGALSAGHQAQLALAIALAKRPRLLILDEPLARLDPLARHEFLGVLMATVAADGVSVIFSSHVLAELERISDYLVLVNRGQIQLAGRVDAVLAGHRVLTGPRREAHGLPAALAPIQIAAAVLVPAAVVLGLVFGWWYRVYVPAAGYFRMNAFALYAPSLAGWMLAGLTLGMAAGAVTGRDGRGLLLTIAGWVVLHATVTLGSAGTPAGDFWPLQAAQLAILAAISALFTGVTIWVLRGAPAPGMPLLRRALRQLPRVPWPRKQAPDLLALELTGARPRLALARVVWRQHRAGLSLAAGVLGVYAILLLVTGLHVHAEPASLRPRLATVTGLSEPGAARNGILLLPMLLPFVIGALVGAALTRPEFDRRTAAFAWAQGITRIRWGTGTLIAAGLMLVLPAIGSGLVFQWWNQPYTATRLADPAFALYAPVFAGWLLVNGAAASLAGTLARSRTVAVFACLVCTVPVAVANAFYLRPHYLPPATAVNRPTPAGSLLLNWYIGKPGGQPLTATAAQRAAAVAQRFGLALANKNDWTRAARALGQLHAAVIQTYEPASRFWPYQAVEAAGLLTAAILLGAATIWIIHRRAV